MGRFSDINRAPSLNEAYLKYQEFLRKDPGARSTLYESILVGDRTKHDRVPIWVDGFGTPSTIHFETRGLAAGGRDPSSAVLGLLTGRFETMAPTTGDNMKAKNFKPSKLGLRQANGALVNRTSRMTGNKYKGYNTDSASSSFGRKSATETELEAVSDIKGASAFTAFLAGGDGRGFFFKDQDF